MTMTATLPRRQDGNTDIKRIGVAYWQLLVKAGIPTPDARKIAAAIAKFDVVQRPPSEEQKQLISEFSPLICRARLWRTHLL
ncbi:MAG: hypothetical protein HC812_05680 [Leptolyngbya sp. RL_3_1]|nr:hypothetical protein [Leptolyngbya sp. RL_3_1]